MTRVYKGMYRMTRSQAAAAVAVAAIVVVAYSVWGAHVLKSQANAATSSVATTQK